MQAIKQSREEASMASGMTEFCEQVNPRVLLEIRRLRPFPEMRRLQESWMAGAERRALLWLAARTPQWVGPDHLTVLGLAAQVGAAVCYALAAVNRLALLAVIACLALNWLGDSLDGTLARFRQQLRPRYGFYVDHMVDTFGALALMGGLALSAYMHPWIAFGLLVAFLTLSIQSYLATHALGEFRLSFWRFGPTELHSAGDRQPGAALEAASAFPRQRIPAFRRRRSDWSGGNGAHPGFLHWTEHGAALLRREDPEVSLANLRNARAITNREGHDFSGCGKTQFAAALKGRDFQSRRKSPIK